MDQIRKKSTFQDQEIVSNDGPSEKDHDGPSENEQATAVDPIYEVETQLMENELPHTLTNTRIENEHNVRSCLNILCANVTIWIDIQLFFF